VIIARSGFGGAAVATRCLLLPPMALLQPLPSGTAQQPDGRVSCSDKCYTWSLLSRTCVWKMIAVYFLLLYASYEGKLIRVARFRRTVKFNRG